MTISFKRVAIINRGEPAVRFLRALDEYNIERGVRIRSVAFYTDPDRLAPFVRLAHEAVAMGAPMRPKAGGGTAIAYTDHDYVIELLKRHECDAVWPGWGFVSEDAQFVARLEAEGIAFIGPSSDAMKRLGDKIEAKKLAETCDVPLAPWAEIDPDWTSEELEAAGARVGFPLMVKASAGGGGRGIRKVSEPGALVESVASVREEVARIFGEGGVLMEACVTGARHIEVQLVVDAEGNSHAIGVRDCSIQRRNQKVIEEAPSPVLPPAIERKLLDASAALAKAAGYRNVGTAEYLYDPKDDTCTFLEVNSRLQVEHTITEMVMSCDLVKAQLDIARGLPWDPPTTGPVGHAVELRVNAENPEEGFRPSPGLLRRFRAPSGPGIRVDSGVAEGMDIAPQFDSMITKLIAWAPTREQAFARALRACRELDAVVEDGATNQVLLCELLQHPMVLDGSADTNWLDRAVAANEIVLVRGEPEALIAAAILEARRERLGERTRFFAEVQDGIPHRLPAPDGLVVDLKLRGQDATLQVFSLDEERYLVGPPGELTQATFQILTPGVAELWFSGSRHKVLYAYGAAGIAIEVDDAPHIVERASGGLVKAPAPAVVVSVAVEEGQEVEAGELLCVLEAMKMEMGVHAPEAGTVTAVRCRANQQVATGDALVSVEPRGDGAEAAPSVQRSFPKPSGRPLDALFVDGEPNPSLISEMSPHEADAVVADVVAAIKPVMLGYDANTHTLARLESLLGASQESWLITSPERWRGLTEPLGMFVDCSELLDRNVLLQHEGAAETPADVAFYEYCRRHREGAEGAPPNLEPMLLRALAWYDIEDLEPTDELREALWRMALSHTHDAPRHRVTSALLRVLMKLGEAGLEIELDDPFSAVLKRIARTARARYPFVRDNALQAHYTFFERPGYATRRASIDAMLDSSFAELDGLAPHHERARAEMARLGQHPDALQSALLGRQGSAPARSRALEALTRRLYMGVPYAWKKDEEAGRMPAVRAEVELPGEQGAAPLLAALTPHAELEAVLPWVIKRATDDALVEIVLEDEPADEAALEARLDTAIVGGGLTARRVTFTWRTQARGERHRTYSQGSEGWAEDVLLRHVHPEAARRIELSKFEHFDLERLAAHERVYAFLGKARANARDERIFVCAEVYSDARAGGDRGLVWSFEQSYFEALRTLREAQAARTARNRLRWNWLRFTIHDPLELNEEEVRALAHRLEPYTYGLSVREVCIRADWVRAPGAEAIPVEIVLRKTGRHRLEVFVEQPSDTPVPVMTPYEIDVVRARRRGSVPPYEIIRMLEGAGGGAEIAGPHPDMGSGRFQEYDLDEDGALVPVVRPFGQNTCSVVVGVIVNHTPKHPEGLRRVWIGSDPNRGMGALSEPECKRVIASLELAEQLSAPVEWLPLSSGAKIAMDSGTENLDWTAATLRKIVQFTQAGGHINIIVHAINVGAQSYWNAEATMLMHCRGVLIQTMDGSMVLTGKKALDFSGGVSAEDERGIGGAERIMGPNGQAQFVARDLGEAYGILFDWYRITYTAPGEAHPRKLATTDPVDRDVQRIVYQGAGFDTIGDIFDVAKNPGRKKPFAIREVMSAVADQDTKHLERFANMQDGENTIVWETHVGGWPVTMLGIESKPILRRGRVPMDGPDSWTGGTLFPQASRKAARAINSASGSRPVVVLANLSGFDGSPESMRRLQLEYGAEIGRAVVNFEGPIVFVVIGRYHGGAYVVFSKALNPGLRAMAVEGSFASVIGGAPAAAVVFPREVKRRVEADERVAAAHEALRAAPELERPALREALEDLRDEVMLEKRGEVATEFDAIHSVHRAVSVGSLDAVISPEALRPAIVAELEAAYAPQAASD